MPEYTLSPELDALIHSVYRGPLEATPWQSFLNQLREALNGNYATLILRPPSESDVGLVLNAQVFSPEVYNSYNETYFSFDPFVGLTPGEVFTITEFVGEEDFLASDYYREYLQPTDVKYILGADMSGAGGFNARLRVTRPAPRDDFNASDKELCKLLLPHLQQAIEIHSHIMRTESERAFYADTIDQMAMGVIILDREAKVLRKNHAAERLLNQHRGLTLSGTTLQVGDSRENRAFRSLVDEVLEAHHHFRPGFVRAFRIADSDSLAGLGLLVRPLPPVEASDGSSNPSLAIFISDPLQPRQAPSDILIELFGFTPAESKLALRLVNGLTLDEASQQLGVSRNTAKSHLSSVFSKTGVARQTQLIQLILNSVAPLAHGGGVADSPPDNAR